MIKYIFPVLMFFVVLFSYKTFEKKSVIKLQAVCIYLFHALAYARILYETRSLEILVMYVLELAFFLIFMYAFHVLYQGSSMTILNNECFFLVLGFIMITRLNMNKGQRQFVFAFAGGIVSLLIPWLMTKLRGLRKLSWLYGVAGIAALLAVFLLGETDYGANLALSLKYISIQPAEFVKLLYVFFIAAMLNKGTGFGNIVLTSFLAAIHVIVLVLSTDLGAAFIYFCVYVIMLYSATRNLFYVSLGAVGGAAASGAAYYLFSHVRSRVMVWLDPWAYIDDKGYQITQALFSVGMGSWFGRGLYKGMPEKIPFVEKDFMFSAFTEEFGVLCGIMLILLCLNMVLCILKAGMNLKEPFYRLLAVGFASVYGIQVFLTIAGGLNMIPITGVTLPLISYGGSSAVSTLMMIAVVQGLNLIDEDGSGAKKRRKKSKKRKRK